MSSVEELVGVIFILFIAFAALAILAQRLNLPSSILLVLAGLVLGFVPGLPRIALDPNLILLLFLPLLLYSSAWSTSWRDFRANLRPISLLAIGLVLITTIVIALVVHIVTGLSLPASFVFGAIISPTDAIAATAIAQRLGVPRRIVTVVEGESLVNDATGLVAYRFAVVAVVAGTFLLAEVSIQFVIVSLGGIAIGLLVGIVAAWVHHHLDDPSTEMVITLLTPFAAYLPAEALNVSAVLAVVTAGLYLTWRSTNLFSPNTRLQITSAWNIVIFLLNNFVFILIGLQLPSILSALANTSPVVLLWYAFIVSFAVILVRILWVFPATYLPRWLNPQLRHNDPFPGWRNVVVVSWTGMRGVVSLAAALALPTITSHGVPFPGRDLIIFLTFAVILATLVIQGLSLPALIHILRLSDDGERTRETRLAREMAARAAIERIDELNPENPELQDGMNDLRGHYQHRLQLLNQGLSEDKKTNFITYQHIRREALGAERKAIIQLRNRGEINDEVLHTIEHEIDLEEQRWVVER